MKNKILDACCGSRMFWFDKNNPNVLFMDKRNETLKAKDRDKVRTIEINPDIVGDFTDMPFENESFYMVVFDPPHLKDWVIAVGYVKSTVNFRTIGSL